MVRLKESEQVDIVRRYNNLETMIDLAKEHGVTRQGIFKVLNRYGVDTTKRQLKVSCKTCQKVFYRQKGRIRKQLNHFCGSDCYFAYLEAGQGAGKYKASRRGQQIARQKIAEVFTLEDGYIVHHEDRNCLNNSMDNLKVFACQGDHVRHHRGFDVEPVYAGTE